MQPLPSKKAIIFVCVVLNTKSAEIYFFLILEILHLDSSSSWLSFGALPSQNIPSKRFPNKLGKARRSIFKHSVSKKVGQISFEDIKKEAEQKLPTGWNMTSSSTKLCFYKKK